MIKRLIFSLCLACAALPAFAAFDLAQLMSDLARHKGGKAKFVETRYLAVLDKPLVSSGEMTYTVRLPGSKSISNRVLLLAALADGETEVRDLLASDDTERMLEALQALGVGVTRLAGEHWLIKGLYLHGYRDSSGQCRGSRTRPRPQSGW